MSFTHNSSNKALLYYAAITTFLETLAVNIYMIFNKITSSAHWARIRPAPHLKLERERRITDERLRAPPVVSGLCDPVKAQCLCRNVASLTL